MVMRRLLILTALVSGVLFLIGSCKDMGNEVPLAPLKFAKSSFKLGIGGSNGTRISGGTPPYLLVSEGDTTIVKPSIAGDSLVFRAVRVGNSTIVVGDNSSPRLTTALTVTVTFFAVAQDSFSLFVGSSASTTISGGTPPYSVVFNSDPTNVQVAITGVTLNINAIDVGSSTIIVADSGSVFKDTVNVNVIELSFATHIQPIFIANCVNAGCHPGNGSPFSLQTGVSYGNLVEVNAITGPCAGDKRVKRSDATASALIKRLEGTCGQRMPLGGNQLPSDQIRLIRDWINQGATNN